LKAAYEQGLLDGVQVLLTDGVQTTEFPEQVGKTADGNFIIAGALGTVPGADGSGLADLTALIQEKLNTEPSAFVPQTWDAMALLVLAAQAAGANTGEAIQSKLQEVANAPGTEVTDVCEALELIKAGEDINYQGASGNVDVDDKGDVIGSYDVWTVNDDGSLEVIDTVKLD
jgi:neutral amino acid transport system substrate-binding protein